MFILNEVKKEDIKIISELENNLFSKEAWSYLQLLKEFENKFSKIWILKVEEKVIGYLIFRKIEPEIEILRIGIKKEYQRKGAGTEFIKNLIEFAKKEKISKIFLEVKASNLQAFNFYKKLGFKEIYRRKNYYNNEDALIMFKEI